MTAGLLLIRRRRPIREPDSLEPIAPGAAATTDGTAGAGRIVHALSEAGIRCDAVAQLVVPSDIEVEQLRSIEVGETFGTVVLASHLVNLPEEALRSAFLAMAVRHLAASGAIVVEHHPVDWAETADDVEPTPGSAVGMEDVRREPPFVSAVSVFEMGGRVVRQPFTARVLSETELAAVLATAGLRVSRRLAPTLLEAKPAA